MSVRSAFVAAAIVLVCVGVGLGFADFGSPEHNRLLRGDAARVEAIRALATRVSLASYGDRGNGDVPPHIANPDAVDPQTAPQPIAYSREAFGRYRVCTAFALPATDDTYDYDDDRAWYHPAGRYCYHFTAQSSTPIILDSRASDAVGVHGARGREAANGDFHERPRAFGRTRKTARP